jgi:uncharacterized membrane protein
MYRLRQWFFAGLLVLVPLAITVAVLKWLLGLLDSSLRLLPPAWHPDELWGIHIPGLGVILAVGLVLAVGAVVSNFLGRKLMAAWNTLLSHIPVVRSIYSSVKQVSDTLFSGNNQAFHRAVLVQWPHPGLWTIAFVTGQASPLAIQSPLVQSSSGEGISASETYLSLYVPTTPNPTGGYLVMAKASDCRALDMSVEAALTYIISMGVAPPPSTS